MQEEKLTAENITLTLVSNLLGDDFDESDDSGTEEIQSDKDMIFKSALLNHALESVESFEAPPAPKPGRRARIAAAMISNNVDSAVKISAMTENDFAENYSGKLEISGEEARNIHARAEKTAHGMLNTFLNLSEAVNSRYANAMNTAGADILEYAKQMPNYQDMFGSLDFCECEHCNSIFGPAAYFADLMRIADKHIKYREQAATLKQRRPDLFTLPLTCENTNNEIPYIKIVNMVMENSLNDKNIYETLAKKVYPFARPFHLAMEQIRKWLGLAGVSLSGIYAAWKKDELFMAKERMKITNGLFDAMTAYNDASLRSLYGKPGTFDIKNLYAELTDPQAFLEITGLDRNGLYDLLIQDLNDDEINSIAPKFYINQGYKNGNYLKADESGKLNLTQDSKVLEYIARFIRLSALFEIDYTKLDRLTVLFNAGGALAIDRKLMINISSLFDVTERYGIGFEDAAAFIGDLKDYGKNNAMKNAFAPNVLLKTGSEWDITADIALTKIIAESLKIDINGVQILYNMLLPASKKFVINKESLSALHRHARLAKISGLNVPQYEIWLKLCGLSANKKFPPAEIDKIMRITEVEIINIYQLDYLVNNTNSVYAKDLFTKETLAQFTEQTNLKNIYRDNPEKSREFIVNELAFFFGAEKNILEAALNFAPSLPDEIAGGDIEKARKSASDISKWLMFLKCGVPCRLALLISKFPQYFGINSIKDKLTAENIFSILKALNHIGITGEEIYYEIIQNCASISKLPAIIDRNASETEKLLKINSPAIKSYTVNEIDRVFKCFDVMDKLKVNTDFIESLLKLGEPKTDYAYIKGIAEQISANNGGKFDSIEPDRRDALLDAFKRSKNMKTTDEAYKYLLMDVSMSETIKISYVKEGLNALQLYLNRCRMGLESGIAYIDMPDAYWSWIMSYTTWEANRKIFVYPENYLLPSIRRTKSKLFKDLESALQQSQITDGYVEEQYIKYLDEYAKLTKLKPCASYMADIGGVNVLFLIGRTLSQPYDYHYCKKEGDGVWTEWQKIDASINAEYITPVYVFNKLHILWLELKPITNTEVNINQGSSKLKGKISYKADIKYTFLNLQGNWIIPQTLVHDELIYNEYEFPSAPTDPRSKNPLKLAFDIEKECFKKITALKLTNKNFMDKATGGAVRDYIRKPDNYERLFIMTGSFAYNAGSTFDFYTNTYDGSDESRFVSRLNRLTNIMNTAHRLNQTGTVMAGIVKVFNEDMEEDCLVGRNEYILFDEVGVNKDSSDRALREYMIRPVADNTKNAVGIHYSGGALKDSLAETVGILPAEIVLKNKTTRNAFIIGEENLKSYTIDDKIAGELHKYLKNLSILDAGNKLKDPLKMLLADLYEWIENVYFDSTKSPASLAVVPSRFAEILATLRYNMGSVHLFENRGKAKVMPVANQPGWFIYDCDNETFLLSPSEGSVQYSLLDSSVLISYPRIEYTNFSPKEFSLNDCNTIINDTLKKQNVLDRNHYMYFDDCTLDKLKVLPSSLTPKTNAIYAVLHNRAAASSNMFESKDVNAVISEDIFGILAPEGKPLKWARVDKEAQLQKDFRKTLTKYIYSYPIERLAEIFDGFINSPLAVSMRYRNTANNKNDALLEDIKYNVTRLTNSGITKLKNKIYLGGIKRFLSLETQDIPVIPALPFTRFVPNENNIILPGALDGVQVDFEGLYGEYNWELFYHAPLMIAQSLRSSNQNEPAKKWFEYIFSPHETEKLLSPDIFDKLSGGAVLTKESSDAYKILADGKIIVDSRVSGDFKGIFAAKEKTALNNCLSGNKELKISIIRNILLNFSLAGKNAFYWNFRPFRHHTLEKLIDSLKDSSKDIKAYNSNPFDPHAIARLRIGAYEKYTVMEYVQNIIDWGDLQFTQYTWESITSATMLYILASDLLGPRPEKIKKQKKQEEITFAKIKDYYKDKDISQFLLYLEKLQPVRNSGEKLNEEIPYNDVPAFFGVPENKMLMGYWDLVEDRLYKIRNSMDINGVLRSLKLFEDPADPLQFIRMAAFSNNTSIPFKANAQAAGSYRFSVLIEHAKNLTNGLMQLGSSLLAALEKYDAEKLMIISNTQEQSLLDMAVSVKENQIEDAAAARESLKISLQSAGYRKNYYKSNAAEFMSAGEIVSFASLTVSSIMHQVGGVMKMAGGISKLIPQAGSPFAMKYGGVEIGGSLDTLGSGIELQAAFFGTLSNCASIMANYKRRSEEWAFQEKIAGYDEANIEAQLKSVEQKIKSAKQELDIHKKTIEYRKEIGQYYKNKFTGEQLYQWMTGRLRGTMFQTYQLALEMSLKAQLAYQTEKNSKENFITSQYWDGAKNGLLAGESLMLALNQMQTAYMSNDERSFEIEKNISLALECPEAFVSLITTGKCEFALTEAMFANDYPGCYLRKIKTVSISVPAVLGPYQTIKAIVMQTGSVVLTKAATGKNKTALEYMFKFPNNGKDEKPDDVLRDYRNGQRIALSHGIDDGGMFTLNFSDERYLPFEGTGAVSKWEINMPKESNRFDFNSISDIIVNIKYTAEESAAHKELVLKELEKNPSQGGIYYNIKQSMPRNWEDFIADRGRAGVQELKFRMIKKPAVEGFKPRSLMIKLDANFILNKNYSNLLKLNIPDLDIQPLDVINQIASVDFEQKGIGGFDRITGEWKLTVDLNAVNTYPELKKLLKDGSLDPAEFKNIEIIIIYERR